MSGFLKTCAGRLVVIGTLFLGLSACGEDASNEPPGTRPIEHATGREPSDGPTARVSVQQVWRPERAYGVEGTVSSVVIQRDGGQLLRRDVPYPKITRPQTLLDKRLEPGSYRVISYQQTCGTSGCESFDPPSARCSADFDVVDHRPVDVLINFDPTKSTCKIDTGFIETG
jgi:hypothetical protein